MSVCFTHKTRFFFFFFFSNGVFRDVVQRQYHDIPHFFIYMDLNIEFIFYDKTVKPRNGVFT